jgi:hypothetical protein
VPSILVAVAHIVILATAGVFSSKITLVGDEVLVTGAKCGWRSATNDSTLSTYDIVFALARQKAVKTLRYTQECYNQNSSAVATSCKSFTASSIPSTTKSVPCPFSSKICASPNAVQVDTGFIDSNTHLGINSKKSERVKFRKVVTCAPTLAEERYSSNWTVTPPGPGYRMDSYKYYYLGATKLFNFTFTVREQALLNAQKTYDLR